MSDISREELNAFTIANEKTSIVLEKIANQLEQIVIKEDKVMAKLENGIANVIISGVTRNYNDVHKETIDSLERVETMVKDNKILLTNNLPLEISEKLSNSSIAKDIEHTKWFLAIAGIVIIVAVVIIRVLDNRSLSGKLSAETASLQHLLTLHMKEMEIR